MIIRDARKEDIPFIINAILEIEKTENSNSYNNLFDTETEETKEILTSIFNDDENFDTELSLNTFSIAEIDGENAGCCAKIFTNQNYYRNKGELFPIHLVQNVLNNFIKNAQSLPDSRTTGENKNFIEYIFVSNNYRKKGVAEALITRVLEKIDSEKVYINVFKNNKYAVEYYLKLGFEKFKEIEIDQKPAKFYPSSEKLILEKKLIKNFG